MRPEHFAQAPPKANYLLVVTLAAFGAVLASSYVGLGAIQGLLHWFGDVSLLTLLVAWLALLPLFVLRLPHVLFLKIARYRTLLPWEAEHVNVSWKEAASKAGMTEPSDHVFVFSDHNRQPDLLVGLRIVALGGGLRGLTPQEISAILSRHLGTRIAPSLAIWAVMPAMIWLAFYAVGLWIARLLQLVGKEFNATANDLNPKTEGQAALGCAFYIVGSALWLGPLVIMISAAPLALLALPAPALLIAVRRLAEYTADDQCISLGYGRHLITALRKTGPWTDPDTKWRRMISVRPATQKRISRIERRLTGR
jgi:hypothetical protein